MGRRSLLTNARSTTLLDALTEGNRRGVAARLAGVSEATFYRWMADPRPRYRKFRESVERAEAEAEAAAVASVRRGMLKNPRYAIWWLENISPEWRRHRQMPEPAPEERCAPPARGVIVINAETLSAYARDRIGPISAPPPEVRARLVEDSSG